MSILSRQPRASKPTRARLGYIATRQAGFFFWLGLVYLALLIVMPVGRAKDLLLLDEIPALLGGFIPLGVPWFGALGGVTIMLYGVFDHVHEWDTKWNYWHVARPFVGAIMGTLGYLILVGVINATGAPPTLKEVPRAEAGASADQPAQKPLGVEAQADADPSERKGTREPEDFIPYYVLAFLLGFRESTFRELVKRAIDVLFGPGGNGGAKPGLTVTPSPCEFGDVRVGTSAEQPLTLKNDGTSDLVINKRDDLRPGIRLTDVSDKTFVMVTDISGSIVTPGASTTVMLNFSPAKVGPHKATLRVQGNFGMRDIALAGTGTNDGQSPPPPPPPTAAPGVVTPPTQVAAPAPAPTASQGSGPAPAVGATPGAAGTAAARGGSPAAAAPAPAEISSPDEAPDSPGVMAERADVQGRTGPGHP